MITIDMVTTMASLSAIVYNQRFETVFKNVIPPNEPETVPLPLPPRMRKFFPLRTKKEALLYRQQVRKAHAAIEKELAVSEKQQARRAAWFETKRIRRAAVKAAKEPAVNFAGDGFWNPFSNTYELTYSEVAALPPVVLPPRVKPAACDPTTCICRVCSSHRRILSIRRDAFLEREDKRQRNLVKAEKLRRKRNFEKRATRHINGRVSPSLLSRALKFHEFLVSENPVTDCEEACEYGPPTFWDTVQVPKIVVSLVRTRDEEDEEAFAEAASYNARRRRELEAQSPEAKRSVYRKTTVPLPSSSRLSELRGALKSLRIRLRSDAIRAVAARVVAAAKSVVSPPIVDGDDAIPLSELRLNVEMMSEDTSQNQVSNDQASNVVMQEAAGVESVEIGSQFGSLRKFCAVDETRVPEDQDRWLPFSHFEWSTSKSANDSITNFRLPCDALYEKDKDKDVLRNAVLVNEFRVRQYMQCDMVVRFQLSSTPFHLGQLMAGWYYQYELDQFSDRRLHPVHISQTAHAIIDASSSNSVDFVIPYRNYRTYMNIYRNEELGDPAYLGTLVVRVLNPLQVVTGSSTTLRGVVSIRFTNCRLMGMLPPTIASRTSLTTEMFATMAGIEAIKYLKTFLPDRNRDQPPCPQQPPYFIPTASGSIATGKNDAESVCPMRIDALAQTPHPDTNDVNFTVKDIASVFSYVKTIEVKSSQASGDKIACFEAGPIWELTEYSTITIEGTTCYRLPTIAVLSQLYAYWRGDIEIRLDFVATRFHQTRLWICWIPGYLGDLTYAEAQSCAGTMFDLSDDNRSTTVVVPYIADRPWWNHRYANGVKAEECKAPSRFCIYVANPLMYNVSVSKSIFINVYVRGGSNFELAIPVQPSIGLSFYPAFKAQTDDFIQAYPGYYPYYAGTWRYFEGGKLYCLRYGPGSDHVAQFEGIKTRSYYKFKDAAVAKTMKIDWIDGQTITGDNVVFVGIDVADGYGFRYLGVIIQRPNVSLDLQKLRDFFCKLNGKVWSWRDKPDYDQCMVAYTESKNTYYSGDINAALVRNEYELPTFEESSDEEFEKLSTESPGANGAKIVFESSPSSSASFSTIGESHMDLKDICRRYQQYHFMNFSKIPPYLAQVNYSFPLLPQGLALNPLTSDFMNLNRDGPIPILLSAYRFYRGGLRFKLMPSLVDMTLFSVQVRPDRRFIQAAGRAGGATIADGVFQHGYASAIQCSIVNPILTVEVPFYMPGDLGLLQRPAPGAVKNQEVSRFISLGEMTVGLSAPSEMKVKNTTMTVLYCLADDFSPYVFQGFPPMCFVRDSKLDS